MKPTKITTFKNHTPDVNGDLQEKIETVWYDRPLDKFFVNLPEHLAREAGSHGSGSLTDGLATRTIMYETRIEGETPAVAQKNFERRCYQYRESVRKARKVIAYDLRWVRNDIGRQGGMTFEKGNGLVIDWEIGYEIRLGSEVKYCRHNPLEAKGHIIQNSMGVTEKVLDWTIEREQFFEALDDKLIALVERCCGFLNDEKKLALLLDSGKGLLALEGPRAKST